MISPFLFNGIDDQNAATNLILREKAALLSIHGIQGLAAEQASAAIAQQAALFAHQQQQNAQQQSNARQTNQQQSTNQNALVNSLNNNFAFQSGLLANGSNSIALNNLSAMSNLSAATAAAVQSMCVTNTNSNSPNPSNKLLWRTHPAFQQEVYNLLASALPWYSALGNFKSTTANNNTISPNANSLNSPSTTDQQMAALHQFWSQNQLNGNSLGNGLNEHSNTNNSLANSGPIRPSIHSAESILQTINRYAPYSYKKELQGDCN